MSLLRGAKAIAAVSLVATGLAMPGVTGAHAAQSDPPGNNGTVKIAELGDVDDIPNNDPHVPCTFTIQWYGFDAGDIFSDVTLEMQAPTDDVQLSVDGPSQVFVGEDAASGAGQDFDAEAEYTLSFVGDAQPQQGYHVKLTVNTPGSRGADVKHKVFWVQPCVCPPPYS